MEIIQNNNWKLTVDLNGGRIRELKYKDKIVLGTYKRIDGKLGNTHICCPNFGSEGMEKFGLPFHGPFRNLEWNLVSKNQNRIIIEVQDLGLKIKQFFEINNGFKQTIRVENLKNKARKINLAIHNYWGANNDWQGTKLNGEIIDEIIKSDSSKILAKKNILEMANKTKYKWKLSGFKYGQFWTSFKELEDKKIYDYKYFCVEPSLEIQGFLDKGKNNLSGLGFLECVQTIELLK